MTDNKNVKVDIIEILNNADGMEHVAIYCANDKGENETMIKVTDIIKLLNSQKAEIKRLRKETSQTIESIRKLARDTIRDTKSEAIKEYKEKVKAILMDKGIYPVLVKNALNEAEKEFTKGEII